MYIEIRKATKNDIRIIADILNAATQKLLAKGVMQWEYPWDEENGFGVIIAGAGMATALAGVLAAHTTLPVIGVPLKSAALEGTDALLATVMMPSGIPVACVAIDGAKNAAYLAAEILALSDPALAHRLKEERASMGASVEQKDRALQEKIREL